MGYGYVTPTNGFTVEGWFYRSSLPGAAAECLVSQQTQAPQNWSTLTNVNGRQLWLGCAATTGALTLDMRTENGTQRINFVDDTASYGNDSAWHHFALRLATDKKTVSLFLDGQVLDSEASAVVFDWNPGQMAFGGDYAPNLTNFGNDLWSHRLAYFAVYEKPLTNNRIAEHYTAGSGGTVYYGDAETWRIQRIAGWADVPDNALALDESMGTLQGVKPSGSNALTLAQDSADAYWGQLFADGLGRLVYHNRRRRYNRTILAVLSEAAQSAPNQGMRFSTDDLKVFNDFRVSRPYGAGTRLVDEASKSMYGRRTWKLEIPVTSDEEVRNATYWLSVRYAQDRIRISNVSLSAENSEAIEYLMGIVELGDVIAFDGLPEHAPASYLEYTVEKISISANMAAGTWTLGLELSPNELNRVYAFATSTLGAGDVLAF